MKFDKNVIKQSIERYCKVKYGVKIDEASNVQILNALGLAILEEIIPEWEETEQLYDKHKRAYYISAEFLMGRALGNNLINLGIYSEIEELLKELNLDLNDVENAEEDAALGNGGLGRLAACFMESGATTDLPLQGYGIRYSNGIFKQGIRPDGSQIEEVENWKSDPFGLRKENLEVEVEFKDFNVKAIPYDTPIIAYGSRNINTLRLWQSEPKVEFDFVLFNGQAYDEAVKESNRAKDISRVLYPNDTNEQGKLLRLKQQYFLVSASLQDLVRKHKQIHGDLSTLPEWAAIQLNDTHPTLAIPEYIRLMVDHEGMGFSEALANAKKIFAYTNHTILKEALEKWNMDLIKKLIPRIAKIIEKINWEFIEELKEKGYSASQIDHYSIIQYNTVHMANLAIAVGYAVNGVAQLHSDLLKYVELNSWFKLFPEKFQNKTNGITPRRWLNYSNRRLTAYISELLGNEDWVRDLSKLKELEKYVNDDAVLKNIMDIKYKNKESLVNYIKEVEGVRLDPESIFDIQVKRLHEYKRQLLNAFYILDLYYRLKENPDMDIPKVTFIFGGKAFPGYARAKAIIKYIGQISNLINNDETINGKIKVLYIQNYRVTYAEKLMPAADVSKQISTAGKEASGTGNMKFMLNGAVTFGTYDGANVEIVQAAGEENNFIFGLRVEDIDKL
ncbi:MAG: glycogen phosphorylase, partial [Candidatus Epulonipiscium fishelsonii]